jgi:hypothetical protein
MRNAAVLLIALATAGAAPAQQPAPTPPDQHVVVPSLPDQPNKEGVVKPSGGMKTDAEGYVRNDATAVDPNPPPPATTGGASGQPAPGPGIGAPAPPVPVPADGGRGNTIVGVAVLTLHGIVTKYETGVSITIAEADGKKRTVPLARKAAVYEGIAVGDRVALRIPLQKPADGKSADRVEKQKPAKAPLPSKFSQAESPKS